MRDIVHTQDWQAINVWQYVYLRAISEPRDNALHLEIEEARASLPDNAGKQTSSIGSIISDKNCQRLSIDWEQYTAYSVRNESFARTHASEKWEGKFIRVYSASPFLEYLEKSTFIFDPFFDKKTGEPAKGFDKPTHYGVFCLNHCVDIASVKPPTITRVPKP